MTSNPIPRTVGELLGAGAAYLARHGVDHPVVACELLASHLLRCKRMELLLRQAEIPAPATVDAWRQGLRRIAAREPVQYVLGEWDFRQLTLAVDRRALIPRPETEQLVDCLLQADDLWRSAHPRIVDVGTGSGCIVLSLASERPRGIYVATDISPDALSLARENAVRCGSADRVEFRLAAGCGEFPAGSIDGIVANLPYIPTGVLPSLDPCIREHEPVLALDGGPDGLEVVRAVARDAAMVLRPGGWLFLEIGDDQGPATLDLLETAGLTGAVILPDLAGKPRFARARQGG